MSVRRHRPPGITPLELWDAVVDGVALYRVPPDDQADAIGAVVRALREQGITRLRGPTLSALPIKHVVIAGGGDTAAAATAIATACRDVVVECVADPVWHGVRGGERLLGAHGASEHGLVVDVGQTAIKRSWRGRRERRPRDLVAIPLELNARAPDVRRAVRAATISWLHDAIVDEREPPSWVVLGLPCEIDDDGAVAGCSYPWDDGDAGLIGELTAGLSAPCLVVNDAELAAVDTPSDRRTLVLTIGLGLGAAYRA